MIRQDVTNSGVANLIGRCRSPLHLSSVITVLITTPLYVKLSVSCAKCSDGMVWCDVLRRMCRVQVPMKLLVAP